MTALVVFQKDRNLSGAPMVAFGADYNQTTGTVYSITLTTTETSTKSITITVPNVKKTLTTLEQSLTSVAKSTTHSFSLTQTSALQVITDTTLLGSVASVSHAGVASIVRQPQNIKLVSEVGVASSTEDFQSGAGHSTFFITLSATVSSLSDLFKGLQVIKVPNATSSLASVVEVKTGAQTFTIDVSAVQTTSSSIFKDMTMTISKTNPASVTTQVNGPFTGSVVTRGGGVSGPMQVSDFNSQGVTKKVELLTPIGNGKYTVVEDSDVTNTQGDVVLQEWNQISE